MLRAKWRGFTLIELLVVVAIIALLISILLPSLSRARELSKRVVCSSNARAIGNACKIYAAEPWNQDQWPTPTFPRLNYGTDPNIIYASVDPNVLEDEEQHSPRRYEPSDVDTDTLSPTRAFWMLIRSGETVPKTYICPSSGDTVDDTEEIDRYYDFTRLGTVSYGYQVPFGPVDTRPSEDVDTRMGLIADKGPHAGGDSGLVPDDGSFEINTAPREWQRFNSSNHGGRGAGEGQNVFFADGHVDFEQTPIVGVDHDNIYTVMGDMSAGGDTTLARISGFAPGAGGGNAGPDPYPGEGVFGPDAKDRATTDALIWP